MTKKTLLTISAVADSIDLVTGWVPGPWSIIVDVPVTIAHFLYAGPRAFIVLLEYAPVVGVLPIYTIAAMSYDKSSDETPQPPQPLDATIIEAEIIPPRRQALKALPPPLPSAPRKSKNPTNHHYEPHLH
jgi:hypothetical protein